MDDLTKKVLIESQALKDANKHALDSLSNIGNIPVPKMPLYEPMHTPRIPVNPNTASEFHRRLINWINDFHKTLDEEHEAGARLVNFGQSITFHIENIGYWNPSLISFIGKTEDGDPVELIQHISQISILLMKMKRAVRDEPKRPIGFASWEEYENMKNKDKPST